MKQHKPEIVAGLQLIPKINPHTGGLMVLQEEGHIYTVMSVEDGKINFLEGGGVGKINWDYWEVYAPTLWERIYIPVMLRVDAVALKLADGLDWVIDKLNNNIILTTADAAFDWAMAFITRHSEYIARGYAVMVALILCIGVILGIMSKYS